MQAESRASRRGASTWGDLHCFCKTPSSKGIRAEDGSNTTSLTDTTVGFIPSAKKEQPRRMGGKITQRRDGQRQRPRLSRCLCLPKTLLPSAGRRDVPASGDYPWWRAQALPLGSVGMLPHCSWAAGTWCHHGTAERCLQDAELMPVSSARPAPLLVLSLACHELPCFCPTAAALPPSEGTSPLAVNDEVLGGLNGHWCPRLLTPA